MCRQSRLTTALVDRAENVEQAAIELGVATKRVPDRAVVRDQLWQVRPQRVDRAGLVDTEALLHPAGAEAPPVPDLASLVARANEQHGPVAAAVQPPRDQHDRGLREARQVDQVRVWTVVIEDVAVADRLGRAGEDQDAVAELVQQALSARAVQGWIQRCVSTHGGRVSPFAARRRKDAVRGSVAARMRGP